MRQVLQNLKSGATEVADVPTPLCQPGHLLIATRRSLISAGTERMLIEFGQANLLAKARAQPERVRQVLDKIRTDGLLPTLEAVFARLDQPLPLGYCNAGVVLEVGEGVSSFSVGDRVVSNGPHAEVVCVPENLCAGIPDGVSDNTAAFTVLAAVGLQGIRLADPTLGENVAVLGLGLVGLMTVQMLRANGCRVLGTDFDAQRLALARQLGAETVDLSAGADPVKAGMAFSDGRGLDAVLITASTDSSKPVHQAAQMCRKRGRIVLVGVTGLELQRDDFYEKELTFQVSCSYGPGRYDEAYEQEGHDYPYGFVRWTEQRNFQAVLNLMAEGKLDVEPLISHRFPIEQAPEAYDLLTEDQSTLGILLTYPEEGSESLLDRTVQTAPSPSSPLSRAVVGVIGAGNFASQVMLPALSKTSASLKTIASATGVSASHAARKFDFQQATSDYHTMLNDPEINTVFIATRHNLHARIVKETLQAGKHVFVEKPLALNRTQLQEVKEAYWGTAERSRGAGEQESRGTDESSPLHLRTSAPLLMVGFNRRFSPLTVRMRSLLAERTKPVSVVYTVNAGYIPADHWTQDPEVGGGRIIGEGCHFIDLVRHLVGEPIVGVEARMMGDAPGVVVQQDKMTILLEFADGSTGAVHYLANGSKRYPKEQVEVFSEGRVLVLNNFKTLRGYSWKGFGRKWLWRQDKGHNAEVAAFVERVEEGGEPLISWRELEEVTLTTLAAVERAREPAKAIEPLNH
jgi:predicted dehydrogenase/threonine dehydrogenase-like Zn-dependent dehydrogenase